MVIGAGSAGCVLANRCGRYQQVFFVVFELSAATIIITIIIIIVLTTSLLGRLTEDPDNQVLLLEAGPKYEQNQFSIWWRLN